MSTFKVQKVEFEPPVKGEPVKPFNGWVCVGRATDGGWYSGCDVDSANDAFETLRRKAGEEIHPATVQMFRVDPA